MKDDVIKMIDDQEISSRVQLIQVIGRHKPGDKVRLKVLRGEKEVELTAKLRKNTNRPFNQNQLGGRLSERRDGFSRVIQHDSILAPEQCGGPILNTDGKAVGINIARAGRVESYALSAATLQPIIAQLKSGKLAPKTPVEEKVSTEK